MQVAAAPSAMSPAMISALRDARSWPARRYRSGRAGRRRPAISPASLPHDLRVRDVRAHAEGIWVIEQLLDALAPAGHELQRRVHGVLLRRGSQLPGRQFQRLVVQVDHRLHVYDYTVAYI